MRLFVFAAATAVVAWAQSPAETAIRGVLGAQEEAWNRGDLEAFLQAYEDSPDTLFLGASGARRGLAELRERYRRVYPDRAAMGRLRFSDLEVRLLGDGHAAVAGRFHLDREAPAGGDAEGVFSLVMRRLGSGWKITLDHTTRREP